MEQLRISLEYFKSDCYRYFGSTKLTTLCYQLIRSPLIRWHLAFRLIQLNHNRGLLGFFGRTLWRFSSLRNRIQIAFRCRIGHGLKIGHDGPVVVNPLTTIGSNCDLFQFTTIGAQGGIGATIGDNVYIGPNVCIVENVKIGDNVTIGAGSVVTKDIPSNATAAGNYARVLNFNNPGRYISHKWERER